MKLTMTRGDTFAFKWQRLDSDGEVITSTPTAMYFTLKASFDYSAYVLQKTIDDMTMDEDGTWHCTLEPEDTEDLACGTYVFDIEVTADSVVTTISKGVIDIKKEATWAGNK